MTDPSTKPRLTDYERHLLKEVAQELDSLWDFKAELGVADSRPGAEYMRLSNAPKLRELAA